VIVSISAEHMKQMLSRS